MSSSWFLFLFAFPNLFVTLTSIDFLATLVSIVANNCLVKSPFRHHISHNDYVCRIMENNKMVVCNNRFAMLERFGCDLRAKCEVINCSYDRSNHLKKFMKSGLQLVVADVVVMEAEVWWIHSRELVFHSDFPISS